MVMPNRNFVCATTAKMDTLHIVCPGLENVKDGRLYSYKELSAATQGFRLSNRIGRGGFGSVFKVYFMTWTYAHVLIVYFIMALIDLLCYCHL